MPSLCLATNSVAENIRTKKQNGTSCAPWLPGNSGGQYYRDKVAKNPHFIGLSCLYSPIRPAHTSLLPRNLKAVSRRRSYSALSWGHKPFYYHPFPKFMYSNIYFMIILVPEN
jgi:hypothetical protein